MRYSRGEIVLVLFPNSDSRTAKRRPALVVQADDLDTGLPQKVVAMISSNLSRAGHPSRVRILGSDPGFAQSGLLTDSVIMTDNMATVLESEIDRAIGRFSEKEPVDAAIRHTFGLRSFRTQGDDGIDPRSAARGQPAGDERGQGKEKRAGGVGRRIDRAHFKEKTAENARE